MNKHTEAMNMNVLDVEKLKPMTLEQVSYYLKKYDSYSTEKESSSSSQADAADVFPTHLTYNPM